MMKVLHWNMRGLARLHAIDRLKKLSEKHDLMILILVEPMIFFSFIEALRRMKLKNEAL